MLLSPQRQELTQIRQPHGFDVVTHGMALATALSDPATPRTGDAVVSSLQSWIDTPQPEGQMSLPPGKDEGDPSPRLR
jgi:hypothetical protein